MASSGSNAFHYLLLLSPVLSVLLLACVFGVLHARQLLRGVFYSSFKSRVLQKSVSGFLFLYVPVVTSCFQVFRTVHGSSSVEAARAGHCDVSVLAFAPSLAPSIPAQTPAPVSPLAPQSNADAVQQQNERISRRAVLQQAGEALLGSDLFGHGRPRALA